MSAIGYRDVGVYQHKDDGSSTPQVGYRDIGVYQHADPAPSVSGTGAFHLIIARSRLREW